MRHRRLQCRQDLGRTANGPGHARMSCCRLYSDDLPLPVHQTVSASDARAARVRRRGPLALAGRGQESGSREFQWHPQAVSERPLTSDSDPSRVRA